MSNYQSSENLTIADIHKSDIKGIWIETGAGVALANALYSVSGASNTIYFSESPYCLEYAQEKFGIDKNVRAVSAVYIKSVMNFYQDLIKSSKINTIYVSSFQIEVDPKKITHGWIGLQYKSSIKLYHITIRENLTRAEYIKKIEEFGLQLLYNLLTNTQCLNKDGVIDIILNHNLSPDYSFLSHIHQNQIVCFDSFKSEPKMCRMEDLFRDKEKIIIYKGSFNKPTV